MQTYDITAPANSPFVVHAAGKYIKYLSGNNGGGDVSLIVTPGSNPGNKLTLVPGQAFRVADDAKTPDSWTLTNAVGGATILGKVVVGNGKIDDNSIAGTVQVVDGGKARTLNGSAMSGYGSAGPVTSQLARIQLWNPANSGKRLVVEACTLVGSSQAEAAYFYFNTTQLGTVAQVGGISKRSSIATQGVGMICTDTTATPISGPGTLFVALIQTNTSYPFKFNEPYVVDPGTGLLAWSTSGNNAMGCAFEWYEEPNV